MPMHIRDARNRRVPLLGRVGVSLVRAEGPIDLPTRAAIRAEEERFPGQVPALLSWSIIFCLIFGVMITAFLLLGVPMLAQSGRIGPFFALMPVLFMVLAGAAAQGVQRYLRRGHTAATIVRHGHCASCGYSLKAVLPQADGCRVCPECGAAWRVIPPAGVGGDSTLVKDGQP